jgi:hypothetical protein
MLPRAGFRRVAREILAWSRRTRSVAGEEKPMKRVRDLLVPVAFFAAWLVASGYTLHALRGLRALNPTVEATIELTVTH